MLHNFLSDYSPWLDVLIQWNLNIPLRLQLKLNEKRDFVNEKTQKINEKVLLMYMIILWTILHSVYKKCLNVYFRNLGYPLIHRNRISNILWSFGLNAIIILYTLFLWDSLLKPDLNVVILKSFYIHYSGIMIFLNNNWLKGFSNFVFMLFVFGISRQSLQPPVTSIFLLKSIDMLMLDVCRMLHLKWPKKVKQIYAKSLYMIYCIFWTYLYMIHVPVNLLMPYKYQSLHEKLFLWLWFITQYLDFVWLDFIKNFKSSQLLELCLFPSPSAESIHLTKILKSQKMTENNNKFNKIAESKKELWQTLMCAMTMKKKINRFRKSKLGKVKKVGKESSEEPETIDHYESE